jgi:capsular polysaccharide biosynthesis protein
LILTTTLTVIAGTVVWAQRLPPLYESSLTLTANSKDGSSIPQGQLARLRQGLHSRLVYYRIVESDLFNDRRAAGASNEVMVKQLQQSIGMTEHLYGSAAVIKLRSLDTNPERAQMVAAAIGKSIEETEAQNASQGNVAFRVEQQATLVPGTIKARLGVVAVFAFGVGILSGLVLAGLSELVGRRRSLAVNSPAV